MAIAAVCERCKRRYRSDALEFGPQATQAIWMNTAVGRCSCGGDIVLVDGGIDAQGRQFYLRSAVAALLGPQITPEDLRWLLGVVDEAKAAGQSPQLVADRIETERPVFATLVKLLRDPATQSVLTIITILFMIAQVLQQSSSPQQPVDADAVARSVVQRLEASAIREQRPEKTKSARVERKIARVAKRANADGPVPGAKSSEQAQRRIPKKGWKNARCQCGSGKRYCECHGK